MSTFRHGYTALTPNGPADFVVPDVPIELRTWSVSDLEQTRDIDGATSSWWSRAVERVRRFFVLNAGLLLIAGSQAFLSMMNVTVKKLNSLDPPVSTLELVFVRMIITYFCGLAYMWYAKIPDPWLGPQGVRLLLISRGFFGFFGLFGIYFALQYLSLSDATVLTFLAPLCTGIAGSLILKEKFTMKEALAGVFSLFGVVLIARPPFLFGEVSDVPEVPALGENTEIPGTGEGNSEQRLIAVGVSLLGVLGSTGAYTSIRAIGKRAHPLHMMSSFSLQCVLVSSIGMIATKTPVVVPTRPLWLALLVEIGLFGFVAQILLTMGLQRETAGRGTIAVYTQVVFATIFERIFFHTSPSLLSVLGTLIIISSAMYIALTKEPTNERSSRDPENLGDITLEEGLLSNSRDGSKTLESAAMKMVRFEIAESDEEDYDGDDNELREGTSADDADDDDELLEVRN